MFIFVFNEKGTVFCLNLSMNIFPNVKRGTVSCLNEHEVLFLFFNITGLSVWFLGVLSDSEVFSRETSGTRGI